MRKTINWVKKISCLKAPRTKNRFTHDPPVALHAFCGFTVLFDRSLWFKDLINKTRGPKNLLTINTIIREISSRWSAFRVLLVGNQSLAKTKNLLWLIDSTRPFDFSNNFHDPTSCDGQTESQAGSVILWRGLSAPFPAWYERMSKQLKQSATRLNAERTETARFEESATTA